MSIQVEMVRNANTIRDLRSYVDKDGEDTERPHAEVQKFHSITKAKRGSREWQKSHGGLGIGKLRVR